MVRSAEAVLRVEDLGVSLPRGGRPTSVLDHLDLTIPAGRMLALVGESGSGKTLAALSVMRLLPAGALTSGRVLLSRGEGVADLLALPEPRMRGVRGRDIGMVFQNPLAALNPSHTIGRQIAESLRAHPDAVGQDRAAIRARTVQLLDEVGIARAAEQSCRDRCTGDPPSGWTTTRTSSPAACGSAPPSPSRSPAGRAC